MLLELEIFSLTPIRAVFVFAHQLLAVLYNSWWNMLIKHLHVFFDLCKCFL